MQTCGDTRRRRYTRHNIRASWRLVLDTYENTRQQAVETVRVPAHESRRNARDVQGHQHVSVLQRQIREDSRREWGYRRVRRGLWTHTAAAHLSRGHRREAAHGVGLRLVHGI